MKHLTAQFINEVLKSKDLVLIQDENPQASCELVKDACGISEKKLFHVYMDTCYPLDIEELLDAESKAVLCIHEIENAHPYMVNILFSGMLTGYFKKSSLGKAVEVASGIQFVLVANRNYYINDRKLYRKLYKLVNIHELINI